MRARTHMRLSGTDGLRYYIMDEIKLFLNILAVFCKGPQTWNKNKIVCIAVRYRLNGRSFWTINQRKKNLLAQNLLDKGENYGQHALYALIQDINSEWIQWCIAEVYKQKVVSQIRLGAPHLVVSFLFQLSKMGLFNRAPWFGNPSSLIKDYEPCNTTLNTIRRQIWQAETQGLIIQGC